MSGRRVHLFVRLPSLPCTCRASAGRRGGAGNGLPGRQHRSQSCQGEGCCCDDWQGQVAHAGPQHGACSEHHALTTTVPYCRSAVLPGPHLTLRIARGSHPWPGGGKGAGVPADACAGGYGEQRGGAHAAAGQVRGLGPHVLPVPPRGGRPGPAAHGEARSACCASSAGLGHAKHASMPDTRRCARAAAPRAAMPDRVPMLPLISACRRWETT